MAQIMAVPQPIRPNLGGKIISAKQVIEIETNYGSIINHYSGRPLVSLKAQSPSAPAALQDFVDRIDETALLEENIGNNKRVSVIGPDGTGKSALLRQVANSATAQKLPNGVVLAEGSDADGTQLSVNDVIQQLFDQLYDIDPATPGSHFQVSAASAKPYLASTRPLVLIDQVKFASPDSLTKLIDLFPKSPILIAQTESPGGNLTRLVDLAPLPHANAIELFAATLNVPANQVDHIAADSICTLLQNLPLAVVTVANAIRANKLAPDNALKTLNQIRPPSSDPIQASLERAYGLMYTTLSPLERQVLAIAATLPAKSIDPAMIQRIIIGDLATPAEGTLKRAGDQLNLDGIRITNRDADKTPAKEEPQPTTTNQVSRAIDKLKAIGILRANSPRLRLAPGFRSIVQVGVDQIRVKERLLDQLLKDVQSHKNLDWQYCTDELGNILGAIEWAEGHSRWQDVITLGRAIDPYLTLHGLWDAWRSVLDRILQAARLQQAQSIEAWALHQIGTQSLGSGDNAHAIEILKQALALRTSAGDTIGAAYTQHNLDVLTGPPPVPQHKSETPVKPAARGLSGLAKTLITLIVVLTAALFSGSIFMGSNALDRCDQPVINLIDAARAMGARIARVNSAPGGAVLPMDFDEGMLNSYIHYQGESQGTLHDGKAFFVQPGLVAICGQLNEQYGNLYIAATVRIQLQSDQPYQLEGISARILNVNSSTFGWVAVPSTLASNLINEVNKEMGNFYRILDLASPDPTHWQLQVQRK